MRLEIKLRYTNTVRDQTNIQGTGTFNGITPIASGKGVLTAQYSKVILTNMAADVWQANGDVAGFNKIGIVGHGRCDNGRRSVQRTHF